MKESGEQPLEKRCVFSRGFQFQILKIIIIYVSLEQGALVPALKSRASAVLGGAPALPCPAGYCP